MLADEKLLLIDELDINESQHQYNVGELISFASFDIPTETNLQDQTTDSLFNDDTFDPFNLYNKSEQNHYPSTIGSTFHVDPFDIVNQPIRETKSPVNLINTNNNNLFAQTQPQLIPMRISTPTPTNISNQTSLTVKNTNLNSDKKKSEIITDLLDFGDPNPPPPPESPKFDPYA